MQLGVPGTKTFWAGEDDFFLPATGQCRGCGSLLASKLILRTIYETDRNAMVFGRTCGGGRSELQTGGRIGCDGSGMMGIITGLEMRGIRDKNLVVMTGDGRMLEMGFGDFTAAFDREEPITWIVPDNQAYASSGSNITPTTLRRTVRVPEDSKVPITEYLKLQERYSHLTDEDIKDIEAYVERQNKLIDALEQALTAPQTTVSY